MKNTITDISQKDEKRVTKAWIAGELGSHHYAEIFPLCSSEEQERLGWSMARDGFDRRKAVVVVQTAEGWEVIEGRNRRDAALRLWKLWEKRAETAGLSDLEREWLEVLEANAKRKGWTIEEWITPRWEVFRGDSEAALALVARENLDRRQLPPGALAMSLLDIYRRAAKLGIARRYQALAQQREEVSDTAVTAQAATQAPKKRQTDMFAETAETAETAEQPEQLDEHEQQRDEQPTASAEVEAPKGGRARDAIAKTFGVSPAMMARVDFIERNAVAELGQERGEELIRKVRNSEIEVGKAHKIVNGARLERERREERERTLAEAASSAQTSIAQAGAWWSRDNVAIHLGDVVEELAKVPDGSVALAIVDEPFDLSAKGRQGYSGGEIVQAVSKGDWDTFPDYGAFVDFHRAWIGAVKPKLAHDGQLFAYATHHNLGPLLHVARELGGHVETVIVLVKRAPSPLVRRGLRYSHEFLVWMHFGSYRVSSRELPEPTDTWEYSPPGVDERAQGSHPTQKAVETERKIWRLLELDASETVLVAFAGSGTSIVAGLFEGHKGPIIAIEREAEYATIAKARCLSVMGQIEEVARLEAEEAGGLAVEQPADATHGLTVDERVLQALPVEKHLARDVEELAGATGISKAKVHQALQRLEQKGHAEKSKKGKRTTWTRDAAGTAARPMVGAEEASPTAEDDGCDWCSHAKEGRDTARARIIRRLELRERCRKDLRQAGHDVGADEGVSIEEIVEEMVDEYTFTVPTTPMRTDGGERASEHHVCVMASHEEWRDIVQAELVDLMKCGRAAPVGSGWRIDDRRTTEIEVRSCAALKVGARGVVALVLDELEEADIGDDGHRWLTATMLEESTGIAGWLGATILESLAEANIIIEKAEGEPKPLYRWDRFAFVRGQDVEQVHEDDLTPAEREAERRGLSGHAELVFVQLLEGGGHATIATIKKVCKPFADGAAVRQAIVELAKGGHVSATNRDVRVLELDEPCSSVSRDTDSEGQPSTEATASLRTPARCPRCSSDNVDAYDCQDEFGLDEPLVLLRCYCCGARSDDTGIVAEDVPQDVTCAHCGCLDTLKIRGGSPLAGVAGQEWWCTACQATGTTAHPARLGPPDEDGSPIEGWIGFDLKPLQDLTPNDQWAAIEHARAKVMTPYQAALALGLLKAPKKRSKKEQSEEASAAE